MSEANPGPQEAPETDDSPERAAAVESEAEAMEQRQAAERRDDPETELEQARERILRLQAELDNLRKRARRELDDSLRYANLPLMRDLLPVVDNIDRALAAAELDEQNAEAGKQSEGGGRGLQEGVKMVQEQLLATLARYDCQPIEALHQHFDPNRHEAILHQPDSEHAPGTVTTVTQQGYHLHDRVIRPTQVIVAAEAPKDE